MTQDAQYQDGRLVALYERLNAADHDHRFYERLLGGGPQQVLDLGCGTGLLARRLAACGHAVTAIDPAKDMVDWGRQQSSAAQIVWRHGFVQDLPPEPAFDAVIMTGHAFQCLTTEADVAQLLAAVRLRLKPGGRFMFESRNPLAREWESWTPDDVTIVTDEAGVPVRCFTSVLSVKDGPRVTFRNHFVFPDSEAVSDSTLLFLSRDAIHRQVLAAGFTAVEIFGHWDGSPMTEMSPEVIVVAA